MFKLRLQFFLVLLLLSGLLTTGLYLFIKISFQQDFWNYINTKESRFTQPLATDLINNYGQHKHWNWLGDWEKYVAQHLQTNESFRRDRNRNTSSSSAQSSENNQDTSTPSANDIAGAADENKTRQEFHEKRRRPPMGWSGIFLLDTNKQLIAGNQRKNNLSLIPLMLDDQTIGYLGVPINPALRDLQDADFVHLQENKLALVIIIALALAALVAFPLAHLLTQRIQQLVTQVGHLSEGKYRERIVVKGKDEISILAEHLNNLSETLAQNEQTRRQWVADISHELRTPLAVLKAELEAMEDGVRPLDAAAVDRLQKHCQRLKHLVDDLYELSLTDLGGMTYRKNTLNLSALLQESVSAMQPQFAQQKIELKITTIEPDIFIFGDHHRLQQLFANLLKNSLQYTTSPGVTEVTLARQNQRVTITINDSAPGVNEAHHEKLFDRLYRADSSRNRATGGAGLGLSICKNIVAAHDGQITIGNSYLGGLKITIEFPFQ